jgi:hypothetical protein
MKNVTILGCTLFITNLISLPLSAEPPATQMTIPGKLLLSEDVVKPIVFAKSTTRQPHPGIWSEGWRVMNGTWTQVDGGIRGTVLPKVYPAATLHLPLVFQDVIIQVDVRLDDIPLDEPPDHHSNSAKIVLREGNAAHIASAQLSKNGFSAAKDKTNDRELDGKQIEDQELSFGKHLIAVKPNTWHTITIEVRGEEMLSMLDGQNPVLGTHPVVGIPKGILSFGTSRSASYRNLQVFEALPNPQWEQNKAAFAKSLPAISRTN